MRYLLLCLSFLTPWLSFAATRGAMLHCAAYMSLARQAPDTPYVLDQLSQFSQGVSGELVLPKFFSHLTVTNRDRFGAQQKMLQQIRGIRYMQFRQGEHAPIKTVAFSVQGKTAIESFIAQVGVHAHIIDQAILAHPQHRMLAAKIKLSAVLIPPGALVFATAGYWFQNWPLLIAGVGLMVLHNPVPLFLYLLPDRARFHKWAQMHTQIANFPEQNAQGGSLPQWSYWTQTYRIENQAIGSLWHPLRSPNYGALRNQDYLSYRGPLWRWFKHHLLPRVQQWPQQEITDMHQQESKGWVTTDELLWFNPALGQPELLVVVRASDQPLKKALPVRARLRKDPALVPAIAHPLQIPNS